MLSKQKIELQKILSAAHRDFSKSLTSHAFFKVGDSEVSKDLVQDTFLKTWKYLVRGGKVDTMQAFLYHVLNHLIVDQYRRRKNVSLDGMLEKGFEPSTGSRARFINMLEGKKAVELIDKLPKKYRKLMKMRYVRDLSLKEMSAITRESKNSLAVQIHRGIEKLKLLHEPRCVAKKLAIIMALKK